MKRSVLRRRIPLRARGRRWARREQEWAQVRQARAAHAGGRCEAALLGACEVRGRHAHHVMPRARGGANTFQNCLWVCWACHDWIHAHPRSAQERGLLR